MQYEYKARKSSGETVEGILDADNRRLVINRLQSMNLFPIRVEEKKASGLGQEVSMQTFRRVRQSDVATFTRQMSDLLRAGLPLVRSLTVLEKQTGSIKFRQVLSNVRADVQGGTRLSDALAKHPKVFPDLYSNMVRAGEMGGMLDQVMERLAEFQEAEREMKSKIVAAMFYPAVMLVLGFSVVLILVAFVIPNFVSMFDELGQDLPLPTIVLVHVSHIVVGWWWLGIVLVVALVMVYRHFASTREGKLARDRFFMKVPIIGDMVVKREVAKFGRTLGTLLTNGVPILKALEITESVSSNRIIARVIADVRSNIREGERLSDRLGQDGIFPEVAVNMVAVGEETGRLEETLTRMAESYEAETDRVLKVLTSMIEPLMIIVMGVMVGFIVYAMVIPIFRLTSKIQ